MDDPHQRFEILDSHLGEGTYGKVVEGFDRLLNKKVAIKKVMASIPSEGLNKSYIGMVGIHLTTIREVKIMMELKHENLMGIIAIYRDGDFINIVMDLMKTDLKAIITSKVRLQESHIKCILYQILLGLEYLHKYSFAHRDLSTGNIFISAEGICKLADFGLSRQTILPPDASTNYQRPEKMTHKVVTLWYRPPELLLGADCYHTACDIWSVGCIFAEMITGHPLFPGVNEIDQLSKIYKITGTPSEENWPEAKRLPYYTEYSFSRGKEIEHFVPTLNLQAKDLLQRLIKLNPHERITATEALKHEYFTTAQLPCKPSQLPI
ncbi:cyclin-dependent kinase 7 [Babesia microti strain RI]|uniref:Cyclin-dependent kinase 2 homolog n=1 Tax=Babesia microti (strain RI) TaxID=1133968 RepID=A0A1R4AC63_BABMR|nr:cyclin-dependent kinase 7 [Babesia microti strain RI]SJK86597.1 cyclin-dependent kinase 7 [Babesia microti strain RI]|eukprot:XP_021338736.1 cyclin-dependent kinase 7 [Babesia microti strain RI]